MADLAYHRKYRPLTIQDNMDDDMKEVILTRFSKENEMPQTILLYGTRGCGKTSAARLIAKEYHCLSKVDGHACGKCEMCTSIEETLIQTQAGVECPGVIEMDIASDSGKAAMDEMLEDALIEPLYPLKYKVIIMDEVHMATKQSQNRMLKIMEEPPKHLVFILCTTDPDDLLGTLKSRCQIKQEVRKPTIDKLADRLLYVCQKEKITTSMEALRIIAKKADRIPREALNLLEDIAKQYGHKVTVENVRAKTGEVAAEIYMEYYKSANKSLEDIMIFNRDLKERGITPKEFIRGLTRFTLDCINLRYGIGIEDYPPDYVKSVKQFFGIYNSEELDMLLQVVEYANKMIDDDDTKAELIITTTAMRIGKLKLLAIGLTNEDVQAEKENKVAFNNYKERLQQDKEDTKKVMVKKLDESLLVSVMGKAVSEVKGGINLDVTNNDDGKNNNDDDRLINDDELMSLFGGK